MTVFKGVATVLKVKGHRDVAKGHRDAAKGHRDVAEGQELAVQWGHRTQSDLLNMRCILMRTEMENSTGRN